MSLELRRDMIALSRYGLTPEDQAIFERVAERRTRARYHAADVFALIKTGSALRSFGSVRECVTVIETAQRSIERRQGGK